MSIRKFIDAKAALVATHAELSVTPVALATTTEEADMPLLQEVQAQLATAEQEKVELSTAKTELETQLASAAAEKATAEALVASLTLELETFKLETQESTRKASLASVLPEDQVDAMLVSTKSLDATAFDVVLGALKTKATLEAETFEEVGFTGTEASAVDPLDRLIAADNAKNQQGNK